MLEKPALTANSLILSWSFNIFVSDIKCITTFILKKDQITVSLIQSNDAYACNTPYEAFTPKTALHDEDVLLSLRTFIMST